GPVGKTVRTEGTRVVVELAAGCAFLDQQPALRRRVEERLVLRVHRGRGDFSVLIFHKTKLFQKSKSPNHGASPAGRRCPARARGRNSSPAPWGAPRRAAGAPPRS